MEQIKIASVRVTRWKTKFFARIMLTDSMKTVYTHVKLCNAVFINNIFIIVII